MRGIVDLVGKKNGLSIQSEFVVGGLEVGMKDERCILLGGIS